MATMIWGQELQWDAFLRKKKDHGKRHKLAWGCFLQAALLGWNNKCSYSCSESSVRNCISKDVILKRRRFFWGHVAAVSINSLHLKRLARAFRRILLVYIKKLEVLLWKLWARKWTLDVWLDKSCKSLNFYWSTNGHMRKSRTEALGSFTLFYLS